MLPLHAGIRPAFERTLKLLLHSKTYHAVCPDSCRYDPGRRCSQGAAHFSRNNSRVLDGVIVGCEGTSPNFGPWSASSCTYSDYFGWAEAASDAAMAMVGEPAFLCAPACMARLGVHVQSTLHSLALKPASTMFSDCKPVPMVYKSQCGQWEGSMSKPNQLWH